MILLLPFPPTTNTYWRTWKGRMILSARGRQYRTDVMAAILGNGKPNTFTGRLAVMIQFSPPDRRRRDLDNFTKGLLDALQHAGVYEDDSQIDDLHLKRGPIVEHGEALVIIEQVTQHAAGAA